MRADSASFPRFLGDRTKMAPRKRAMGGSAYWGAAYANLRPDYFTEARIRKHVRWCQDVELGTYGYETGPRVLEALAAEVLPIYGRVVQLVPGDALTTMRSERVLELVSDESDPAAPLAKALAHWAHQFSFGIDDIDPADNCGHWRLDVAMFTLRSWCGSSPRIPSNSRLRWMLPACPDDQIRPTRAGLGEFYHPDKCNRPAIYVRHVFMERMQAIAPEALRSLATDVRPHFCALREQYGRAGKQYDLLSLTPELLRSKSEVNRGRYRSLLKALDAWCGRWHLDAEWVRKYVLFTLFNWSNGNAVAEGKVNGVWGFPGEPMSDPFPRSDLLFNYQNDGWRMTEDTRALFRRRAVEEFEMRLDGYISNFEDRALAEGWKRTPQIRRSKSNQDPYRAVEWLVRWNIQEWPAERIAARYGLGNRSKYSSKGGVPTNKREAGLRKREFEKNRYKSVHDALERAAELVGLPLRKSGRSR